MYPLSLLEELLKGLPSGLLARLKYAKGYSSLLLDQRSRVCL